MDSILDILKKEDELIRKYNNLGGEYTGLLRKIDDYEHYPDYYCVTDDEISAMKERIFAIEKEIDACSKDIRTTREKIRQNLIRAFDY